MPTSRLSPIRVILVTAPAKDAEKIATTLLNERLIACANLLPQVTSLYWWEGRINRDSETLLLLKAPARSMAKLLKRLKQLHSYQVPEFLALGVLELNPDYGAWVIKETRAARARTGAMRKK
jgi:periplasmic divalent cation tolerance protein